VDEEQEEELIFTGRYFVIDPNSKFRKFWMFIMAIFMVYTGTVMPYRLCFVGFRVGWSLPTPEEPLGWVIVERMVDIFFWSDLVLNFFVAYELANGEMETRYLKIATQYMKGWFWLDFVACLPPELFSLILGAADDPTTAQGANRVTRIARMYRVGRIARLARLLRITRLVRLVKMVTLFREGNALNYALQHLGLGRFFSILKFIVALMFVLHILACCWYFIAWTIDNPTDTWVARRGILREAPAVQWLHALYFVLTVFTTVGFGDMYALDNTEIVFVMMLMLFGAVLQSLIISEVISVLTNVDSARREMEALRGTVHGWAASCQLPRKLEERITKVVEHHFFTRSKGKFDRGRLLTVVPLLGKELMMTLQGTFFNGKLDRNRLFAFARLDPRMVTMASIHMVRVSLAARSLLYEIGDQPQSLFAIISGTVSFCAVPSPNGGVNSRQHALSDLLGMHRMRRSSTAALVKEPEQQEKNRMSLAKLDVRLLGAHSGDSAETLFPYELLSFDTYVGELELVSGAPRVATVRAEREVFALELPRPAFVMLAGEFPSFLESMRRASARRERRRQERKKYLTKGRSAASLAACIIQEAVRMSILSPPSLSRCFMARRTTSDNIGLTSRTAYSASMDESAAESISPYRHAGERSTGRHHSEMESERSHAARGVGSMKHMFLDANGVGHNDHDGDSDMGGEQANAVWGSLIGHRSLERDAPVAAVKQQNIAGGPAWAQEMKELCVALGQRVDAIEDQQNTLVGQVSSFRAEVATLTASHNALQRQFASEMEPITRMLQQIYFVTMTDEGG